MTARNPENGVTINGETYHPTMQDVLDAMRGARSRPVLPGTWYAVVRGRKHPLKVVVATTLGLPRRRDLQVGHARTFARHVGLEHGQEPGKFVR